MAFCMQSSRGKCGSCPEFAVEAVYALYADGGNDGRW